MTCKSAVDLSGALPSDPGGGYRGVYLSARPLYRFVLIAHRDHHGRFTPGREEISTKYPAVRRGFYRAIEQGRLTVEMAEKIADHFGYHPAELWPEWRRVT